MSETQNQQVPQFFQEFVTEKAIMTLLGIETKKEMNYLVSQRKFPAVKVKGSKRCYYLPSVKIWLLEHQVNQVPKNEGP